MSLVTPKSVIAVGTVLPSLAAIAVGLRFYIRRSRTTSIGVDDWLILFALLLCIGLGVMMIVGSVLHALATPTPLGVGPKGFAFVLTREIVITEKMKFILNVTQVWAFGAIKLSVIFFYRRIFRGKGFEICSKAMMAIIIAWTLSFFFSFLFGCGTNFEANWSTLEALLTECHPQHTYQQAMAVSDVLTDALILAIPIPLVWQLQLSTARKVGVCGVFLLGAGAIAASIARLAIFNEQLIGKPLTLSEVEQATPVNLKKGSFSQSQGILLITTWLYFTMIEMGISIIAACMPTLRPLLSELSPETLSQLRSVFSLQSLSSSILRRGQSSSYRKRSEDGSNSSSVKVANSWPDNELGTETQVMTNLEAQSSAPPGKIVVQNDISHHSSIH